MRRSRGFPVVEPPVLGEPTEKQQVCQTALAWRQLTKVSLQIADLEPDQTLGLARQKSPRA